MNNLDLRVYDGACLVCAGNRWNGSTETSTDSGCLGFGTDNWNNLEMVVPAGRASFDIGVYGKTLGAGYAEFSNQPFSLYVQNARKQ